MRRVQKILLGIFLGGVLLGGIGTGVALVEYSSLVYAGEKRLGEEYLVTRELDYKFQPEEEEVQLVRGYWDENEVEADETVPEGVIRYVITYNEKQVKPLLNFEEDRGWEEETETEDWEETLTEVNVAEEAIEEEGVLIQEAVEEEEAETDDMAGRNENLRKSKKRILLHLNVRYISSDFAVFMQCKDEILTELKNKRIFNYDMAYITDLKIKVNPQTMPFVHGDF